MNNYSLGQGIEFPAVFRLGGVLTDPGLGPDDQEFLVRSPKGELTKVAPTQDSQGMWHATFTPHEPGVWAYRWRVFAPFEAEFEDVFFVRQSNFAAA